VEIIANGDPDGSAFKQTMDNVNRLIAFYKLPTDVAIDLREYFYEMKQVMAANARQEVMGMMTAELQQQVAWELHTEWLKRVPFFKDFRGDLAVEIEFLAEVATKLKAAVYPPGEKPPSGSLYVIFGGAASYRGRVLSKGNTWGELDVMLSKPPESCKYRATSIQYLHVLHISRDELKEVGEAYPSSKVTMRKWAFYRGVKEYLITWNKERKHQEAVARQAWNAPGGKVRYLRKLFKREMLRLRCRKASMQQQAEGVEAFDPAEARAERLEQAMDGLRSQVDEMQQRMARELAELKTLLLSSHAPSRSPPLLPAAGDPIS